GVGDLGITDLSAALQLTNMTVEQVGTDLIVDAEVRQPSPTRRVARPSSRTAQAVWFPRAGAAEVRREELPPLGPTDVRVQTLLSAISHGTEMLVYRGQVDPGLGLDLPTLKGSFAFPIKYGYACVGRVTAAGEAVGELGPGDLVFGLHPHQTEFVVPAGLARKVPPSLAPEAAIFYANLETALNVLLDVPLRLGETALIFGQGVVGLLLTQLARRSGAGRVIAVDPFLRRRALARRLGADLALSPDEATPESLAALTAGRGPDVVYEASGSPAALQQAIDAAGPQGTVAVVSWYGRRPVMLDLGGHFHRGRVRLLSSQVGTVNPSLGARWGHSRRTQAVCDLLPGLDLAGLISHRYPLARAAEAYRLLAEHPEETVQVVLTYGDEEGSRATK
ncbi:MAG: zinc-dependent alcohol dehydrogenase, partial [Chloroflexota bacterium]